MLQCDICGQDYADYSFPEDAYSHYNAIALRSVNARGWDAHRTFINCCPECMKSIEIHIKSLGYRRGQGVDMILR